MRRKRVTDSDARGWTVLGKTIKPAVLYTIFIIATLIFALPALWLFLTAIKSEADYSMYPIVIVPKMSMWSNFHVVLFDKPFLARLWNTLLLAVPSTIIAVFSSAMVGFAFARLEAPYKRLLFTLVLSMLMVPAMVTLIPNFIMFTRLKLTDTYIPWYLWALAGNSFHIFLFRQYFATIPKDLEDAAEVDGCSRFRIFLEIFLPLAKPVIAVSAIFYFQGLWGDWITPNIFLSSEKTTLGVLLANGFADPHGTVINTLTMAGISLYILPSIIIYLFVQRYMTQGIVTTGMR